MPSNFCSRTSDPSTVPGINESTATHTTHNWERDGSNFLANARYHLAARVMNYIRCASSHFSTSACIWSRQNSFSGSWRAPLVKDM